MDAHHSLRCMNAHDSLWSTNTAGGPLGEALLLLASLDHLFHRKHLGQKDGNRRKTVSLNSQFEYLDPTRRAEGLRSTTPDM